MSLPSIRSTNSPASQIPDGFSRSEGKQLSRLQNAELTHGLVALTRVQAAAAVASIGLQATGMLSREAAFQADGDPVVANRMNFVVDQFAMYVSNELAQFGR